ncbi:hypothetical protein JL720_7122 [Aureococcus anophagefferens]|nr:hypothetical protein JL720_7122 [Aureococcus anophagefferens]
MSGRRAAEKTHRFKRPVHLTLEAASALKAWIAAHGGGALRGVGVGDKWTDLGSNCDPFCDEQGMGLFVGQGYTGSVNMTYFDDSALYCDEAYDDHPFGCADGALVSDAFGCGEGCHRVYESLISGGDDAVKAANCDQLWAIEDLVGENFLAEFGAVLCGTGEFSWDYPTAAPTPAGLRRRRGLHAHGRAQHVPPAVGGAVQLPQRDSVCGAVQLPQRDSVDPSERDAVLVPELDAVCRAIALSERDAVLVPELFAVRRAVRFVASADGDAGRSDSLTGARADAEAIAPAKLCSSACADASAVASADGDAGRSDSITGSFSDAEAVAAAELGSSACADAPAIAGADGDAGRSVRCARSFSDAETITGGDGRADGRPDAGPGLRRQFRVAQEGRPVQGLRLGRGLASEVRRRREDLRRPRGLPPRVREHELAVGGAVAHGGADVGPAVAAAVADRAADGDGGADAGPDDGAPPRPSPAQPAPTAAPGNPTAAPVAAPTPAPSECADSSSWYKKGDPSKDCAWVAAYAPRCGARGETTFAFAACRLACGCSAPPSPAPSLTPRPSAHGAREDATARPTAGPTARRGDGVRAVARSQRRRRASDATAAPAPTPGDPSAAPTTDPEPSPVPPAVAPSPAPTASAALLVEPTELYVVTVTLDFDADDVAACGADAVVVGDSDPLTSDVVRDILNLTSPSSTLDVTIARGGAPAAPPAPTTRAAIPSSAPARAPTSPPSARAAAPRPSPTVAPGNPTAAPAPRPSPRPRRRQAIRQPHRARADAETVAAAELGSSACADAAAIASTHGDAGQSVRGAGARADAAANTASELGSRAWTDTAAFASTHGYARESDSSACFRADAEANAATVVSPRTRAGLAIARADRDTWKSISSSRVRSDPEANAASELGSSACADAEALASADGDARKPIGSTCFRADAEANAPAELRSSACADAPAIAGADGDARKPTASPATATRAAMPFTGDADALIIAILDVDGQKDDRKQRESVCVQDDDIAAYVVRGGDRGEVAVVKSNASCDGRTQEPSTTFLSTAPGFLCDNPERRAVLLAFPRDLSTFVVHVGVLCDDCVFDGGRTFNFAAVVGHTDGLFCAAAARRAAGDESAGSWVGAWDADSSDDEPGRRRLAGEGAAIEVFARVAGDDVLRLALCANQIFNPTSISLVDLHTGLAGGGAVRSVAALVGDVVAAGLEADYGVDAAALSVAADDVDDTVAPTGGGGGGGGGGGAAASGGVWALVAVAVGAAGVAGGLFRTTSIELFEVPLPAWRTCDFNDEEEAFCDALCAAFREGAAPHARSGDLLNDYVAGRCTGLRATASSRGSAAETDSTRVRVHYLGWKKTTDQWLEAYMVHVDDRAKPDKMKSSDNAGTPNARDGTTTPTLKAKKKNKA